MPLARYALYAQDIDIYVAPTWDASDSWLATMRHIAKEAGCWVIGTATAMQGSDVPDDFPDRDSLFGMNDHFDLVHQRIGGLFKNKRPDIFSFSVNRQSLDPVNFLD